MAAQAVGFPLRSLASRVGKSQAGLQPSSRRGPATGEWARPFLCFMFYHRETSFSSIGVFWNNLASEARPMAALHVRCAF